MLRAIDEAVKGGSKEDERKNIVMELLKHKDIDPNVQLKRDPNRTTLIFAAEKGYQEMVQFLLTKSGINLNIQDKDKRTALIWAANRGDLEIVKLLLAKGGLIKLNIKDKDGSTALHNAAWMGRFEVIKVLVEAGADITIKNNDDRTAQGNARESGEGHSNKEEIGDWLATEEMRKVFIPLLKKKGRPEQIILDRAYTEIGTTERSNVGTLAGIGESRFTLDNKKTYDDDFSYYQKVYFRAITVLIPTGTAMVMTPQEITYCTLTNASEEEELLNIAKKENLDKPTDVNRFRQLLNGGTCPNFQQSGDEQRTALIWAANRGHIEIVELLLAKRDLRLNIQDKDGSTALHNAGWFGRLNIIEKIVQAGADPTIRTGGNSGNTPEQNARSDHNSLSGDERNRVGNWLRDWVENPFPKN